MILSTNMDTSHDMILNHTKSDITVNDIFITIHQKAGPSEPRYKGEQSTAWATRPNRSLHDAQIPFQLGMFPVGGIPTPEKYDFVSWDDDIPNIWKNHPHVWNHQPVYI